MLLHGFSGVRKGDVIECFEKVKERAEFKSYQ